MAYRAAMPRLLREVGWEVESDEFTEIEDPDPENHEKRQRELISEIEEARRQLDEKQAGEKKGGRFAFWRKKKNEKKEWEMYDERAKASAEMEEPEVDQGQLEKRAEGVLFDIEAIRAEVKELAGQDVEVRQLESTLPPMKITMSSREGTPEPTPPPMLRATKSHNDGLISSAGTPSTSNRQTFGDNPSDYASLASPQPTNGYHQHRDEEITMSFDMPSEPRHRTPEPTSSTLVERPPLKTHSTAPVPQQPVNMNPEYNAWDDEFDEFGQEKEIKMTFA
jgi:hypothetical protein